jgi:ATP-binding cassette, subfamily G (WHITE), member 2, SNQ2
VDDHIATLTVSQTIGFALSTKTPARAGRLPDTSRHQFVASTRDVLLRMLNIKDVAQTLVGNEFVRGVSGGERRRVSIAEAMATRARMQSWDYITRGLDSSTALDLVRSLRIMTDVLGQTTFVSLHQASDTIYELFDKVILFDHGHQIYFGPPSRARGYFEELGFIPIPRQSTADYLTGCTDPLTRQLNGTGNHLPTTPLALAQAFKRSPLGAEMREERAAYARIAETEGQSELEATAFRDVIAADRGRRRGRGCYTRSFVGQTWALTRRQFLLGMQDWFAVWTDLALSTVRGHANS